jgi:chromosome segregation ATPase
MFTTMGKLIEAVKAGVAEYFQEKDKSAEGRQATRIIELEKEKESLKKDIRELEHKKSLEEREIEHLVKMKEEKIEIETEKEKLKLQADFDAKTMQLQTDYHERVLKLLDEARKEMKVIHTEILQRLPNVNMSIRQDNNKGA